MADLIGSLLSGLGNLLYSFFSFLMKPISWLMSLLDGIFYFVYKLSVLLATLLGVFVAFFQLILAIAAGLVRTVQGFLSWSGRPLSGNYGSDGWFVLDSILDPLGLNTVLPYLLLALDIFMTGYLVIWLVGGRKT